jgi:hypothetical protein
MMELRQAENCTHQSDDNALQPAEPTAVIPCADALRHLASAQTYWLTTVLPDGRPHVRPVLAVWVDGMLCTTEAPGFRRGSACWLRRDPVVGTQS